jgi:AcrR family transcriptional regulator
VAVVVEHDLRRRDFLNGALDVFIDEGYEDTTFQKIADRCGVTRTTLYLYFKNKREIFVASIKQMLQSLDADIRMVKSQKGISAAERISRVLITVIERLEKEQRLLQVVLDYLMSHFKKSGNNPANTPDMRVRRRTVRMRHYLSTLLIEAMKSGEMPPTDITAADELLYGFIEAAVFRVVVLKRSSVPELKASIPLAVARLCPPGA